ncbi:MULTISPECIES: MurR/RpiR family transcriptional regulator [Paracoccaceae]|jgi:DNA-binding MurR/RpiR family transcriptional regulator|uniref:MurR/RpiR family transcriptional regulator n=1 Tax=Rhodobacterales TaxID=204455 RepID=UPI001B16175B|nr:MurR/RpiR family transcriptional regulator [Boseongicola sp. H5]MBO6601884.1 MurR/RpiR family transcriptional regulator [Roseicyclus sp.]MBO6623245.1 MurR/RpiR family transcriptional regulator [Roseicyclus sp.]MBO6922092.1 MurR/RpiR family transcriptional regulator [Roseicyclus sp.]
MSRPLRDRLNEALATASKADRALAGYMLSDMSTLPFETAASLAVKVGVSEPTVGRFCRSIGYDGFKDLKKNLKNDMGDQPWLIGDRLRDLQARTKAGEDQLARGLELEMAALVAVYEAAHSPDWHRAVKRLAGARRVFAAGFQTERGMAQIFVNQLQYLREDVHLLDLAGGNFAEVLAISDGDAALVIFEARRYSRHAQLLAREAKAAGIPVTLITDPYCDWGREVSTEMFVVPTAVNLFWESTAQMASLANLLVNGVFLELGPEVEDRMNRIARLYGRFTGHVGDPATPRAEGHRTT